MSQPNHPLTIQWVLFGFKGRISRKSFWLAALGVVLVQAAVFAQVIGTPEDSSVLALWGLVLLAVWLASAWAALALAVKRLHDLDLPAMLAILLLVPTISFFAFLFLAFMPSKQVTNRHGPPPFPNG